MPKFSKLYSSRNMSYDRSYPFNTTEVWENNKETRITPEEVDMTLLNVVNFSLKQSLTVSH